MKSYLGHKVIQNKTDKIFHGCEFPPVTIKNIQKTILLTHLIGRRKVIRYDEHSAQHKESFAS